MPHSNVKKKKRLKIIKKGFIEKDYTFYFLFKGMKADEIPTAVNRMIKELDFEEKKDYIAKNLSGGQKRRLSVGIAFIGGSKIIILDEPTSVKSFILFFI